MTHKVRLYQISGRNVIRKLDASLCMLPLAASGNLT